MLVRKLLYLFAVTILVASVPCLAADESLTYTGDLFAPYAMTYFSALATDDGGGVPGVPLLFQGTTVWNRQWNAGPVNTNSVGKAYIKALWPPDVYDMEVIGKGGEFTGLESEPVAVTIFNPAWPGIYAGGAIDMNFFGAPPNFNFWNPTVRTATFGFFSKTVEEKSPESVVVEGHPVFTTVGRPSWLLFLDPDNPLGSVKITAQNFKTTLLVKNVQSSVSVPNGNAASVYFYGYCWFQQGSAAPVYAYMDGYLDVNMPFLLGVNGDGGVIQSDHPYFEIFVTKYPATDLYGAWGDVYHGGAYLKCTGGHKPPPP